MATIIVIIIRIEIEIGVNPNSLPTMVYGMIKTIQIAVIMARKRYLPGFDFLKDLLVRMASTIRAAENTFSINQPVLN